MSKFLHVIGDHNLSPWKIVPSNQSFNLASAATVKNAEEYNVLNNTKRCRILFIKSGSQFYQWVLWQESNGQNKKKHHNLQFSTEKKAASLPAVILEEENLDIKSGNCIVFQSLKF